MVKFNNKTQTAPNAISHEGGEVYNKNAAEAWLNFLFSSYLEDRFYETSSSQLGRFVDLTEQMIKEYGAEFVANAAGFARNELGMRSAAQYIAAMLNSEQFADKRVFFRNFCHRPDDVAEVFAAIKSRNEKRSHAAVRGFGDYISSISPYTLGKYKLNGHDYNMYDVINLTHAHSDAIDAYKADALETPDTWEVAISGASNEEERTKEWVRLVETNSLGYLALIRNLRNILMCGVDDAWIKTYLVPQIVNEKAIHKSLVFPYQIYSAYKNMGIRNLKVADALSDAFKIALDNLPHLDGNTLIILDVSGSMEDPISRNSKITIKEAGAVYAMCIILTSKDSELIKFGSEGKYHKVHRNGNVFDEINRMQSNDNLGYGTYIQTAYDLITKAYDRIMLISDMQIMSSHSYGWGYGQNDGKTCYQKYCRRFGQTPIYSFDLGNYRTQTDNPNNPLVHLCTSLSEKTLRFIGFLENGESLVKYINDNYDFRKSH